MAACIILCFVIFLFLFTGCTYSQDDNFLYTDVCKYSGRQLQCSGYDVLEIKDILCLPGNYTCHESERVKRLCDRKRSCASVGLRQQFHTFCKSTKSATIISYRCVSTDSLPPCRTNICSNESVGIHCGAGSSIHIIRALCNYGDIGCDWKVYYTLYTACEHQKSCYASGLRSLMPENTCADAFYPAANVFVDYICVQDNLIHDKCYGTGVSRVSSASFGFIENPGFPGNPRGNANNCTWKIAAARDEYVEVTIHLSYSREKTANCYGKFLEITYIHCRNYTQDTKEFCWVDQVNSKLRSCGNVLINNKPYRAGDDRGNRFLVSYEVRKKFSSTPSYTPYMAQCQSGFEVVNVTSAVPYTSVSEKAPHGKRSHDEDERTIQGIRRLRERSAEQAINETETNDQKMKLAKQPNSMKPWRFLTIVKVVVVNVFLFIVAVSLVVAIIYVCYRYKQVSKSGRYNLAPQSDTDSGRRTISETPLQTFTEDLDDSSGQGNSTHSFMHHREGSQVYASLSEDPYASVDGDPAYPNNSYSNVNQNGRDVAGLTSFRPKTNPYASYSSLDYDVPAEVHENSPHHAHNPYVNSLNIHQSPYSSPAHQTVSSVSSSAHSNSPYKYNELEEEEFPPPPDHLTLMNSANFEDDVPHYTINNDEYAIVQKPKKKPPNSAPVNHYNTDKSASNSHSNRPFASDTGYLPQHQCMLSGHTCNVPPFIPQRQNGNAAYYGSNKHAQPQDGWDEGFY